MKKHLNPKNMKKNLLFLAITVGFLAFGCGQSGEKQATTKAKDDITNSTCYQAKYETESADLKLNTLASGKVSGTLLINYADKPKNDGFFTGELKGDTLFVDYSFKVGTDSIGTYTNPLAFLKKDGKLIMGVGQIETTLGRSYFVKGKPINFEAGKFVFEPKDCK